VSGPFQWLLAGVRVLIGVLMLAAIAINFANVVARRAFSEPIIWTEEALIYIMVWMVFFGAVLVSWDGRHLRMDLLSSSLRGFWGKVVNGLAVGILIALCVYMMVHSWGVIATFAKTGQVSIAAGLPMTVPHVAILIGFVLIFVGLLIRFRYHVSGAGASARDEAGEEAAGEPGTRPGKS
jgi:TRAP-type C4-dicarboxylate transport system permease small subunit